MTASWLRHPARTIRRLPCPSGDRYASHNLALAALGWHGDSRQTPVACDRSACRGWHLTDRRNP